MPLISPATVTPTLSRLVVIFVCYLIAFLAYPSQYYILWPLAHWERSQKIWFNYLICSIWISYYRCINGDPGTLRNNWVPDGMDELGDSKDRRDEGKELGSVKGNKNNDPDGILWGKSFGRWCTKCQAWKPPRCHHCKKCGKCILRMDHHCPWTNNCIGYRNLPHFFRFLGYTTFTCTYLEYHLIAFAIDIWDVPSYRGPSIPRLILLAFLIIVNTFTTFSLTVLFLRTIWSAAEGTTTIESWERERHASLVRRKLVKKVVFPWDIGIWENLVEIMGTWKIWKWPWVLASDRKVYGDNGKTAGKGGWNWERDGGGGVRWEVNGFEDPSTPWPPPDPDRTPAAMFKDRNAEVEASGVSFSSSTDSEYVAAFRRRQEADLQRWQKQQMPTDNAGWDDDIYGDDIYPDNEKEQEERQRQYRGRVPMSIGTLPTGYGVMKPSNPSGSWDGVWRNEEGETLADYGVDEEAEGGLISPMPSASPFLGTMGAGTAGKEKGKDGNTMATDAYFSYMGYRQNVPGGSGASASAGGDGDDDEDISLGELLRRRRAAAQENATTS